MHCDGLVQCLTDLIAVMLSVSKTRRQTEVITSSVNVIVCTAWFSVGIHHPSLQSYSGAVHLYNLL